MKLKKVYLSVTSDEAAYFLCIRVHIYTFNMEKKAKSAKFFLNLVNLFSLQKPSGISTKSKNFSIEVLLFFSSIYLQCIFFMQ